MKHPLYQKMLDGLLRQTTLNDASSCVLTTAVTRGLMLFHKEIHRRSVLDFDPENEMIKCGPDKKKS